MHPKQPTHRSAHRALLAGALTAAVFALGVDSAVADGEPPVTVGAGMQTNFYQCSTGCVYSPGSIGPGDSSVQGFALDTIRLYVNGTVTDNVKFTFNTEYTGSGTDTVIVMDAIGRFEFNDQFNIWAGRFLPPSDRANLYGPYYANDWAPYADGVADFYPDVAIGRDNGIAYWGQFGILKVQVGAFDGESINSAVADKSKLVTAARLTLDFWDPEPGYYFNGTYYGEKNLLAVGLAAQNQDSKSTYSIDALMERNFPGAGTVTIESEYNKDNGLTGTTDSDGWYALGAYVLPQAIGVGKVQVLGKYSKKTVDSVPYEDEIKTTEVNLNYIIKSFSARTGLYFLNQKDDLAHTSKQEFGLKLQLQM